MRSRSALLKPLLLSSCALLAVAAGGAGADPAQDAGQRRRLEAEMQRLETAFAAELAACATRFAVTDCSEEVRLRRRATLAPLRAQQLALDDTERSRRAAARLAAVEAKRQTRGASVPEPPPPLQATSQAPPRAAAPLVVVNRQQAAARQQAASEAAARRAAASGRRQQEAEQAAQRVRERLAQRERSGTPAAPLPVLPAAAASR